jgi:hypothetical protein
VRYDYIKAAVLYGDIAPIYEEFNGSISDTNIATNADINGIKFKNRSIPAAKMANEAYDSTNVNQAFQDSVFTNTTLDSLVRSRAIDYNKMERRVAYGAEWLAYSCPAAAYDLADTLLPDSTWTFYVDFTDSSDIGDPAFVDAPRVILLQLYEAAVPALYNKQGWAAHRDSLYLLDYRVTYKAATGCSVWVHWNGHDTIAVNGLTIEWEARE